ncbi:hypothetical protein DY120_06635 [Apilactobacillus micheneri]|uniref:ABC transporter permease n=1 Tax=Apilactobacillus micheneri TaxID=1899430 RepID=A0ABY2YVQ1_9LACO|nr:hypothetical protein [Apilactobacillus micheneri]TPR24322.1 hypothetical protein DY114_06635 [Apilactobacillus micheneri]TPR25341.1 hypothetical protein DY111_06635 [Apilactobacillus micheneri]TPR27653.1 hypothetical protein DY113_05735 [Apilactobacillus micheneri]TPR28918.1 hypothetical protein DY117_06635 [Apilactobacillus micheneri]TPR29940.1 hypothetical protein DY120_06635 [Apilactobacillus micheneri]
MIIKETALYKNIMKRYFLYTLIYMAILFSINILLNRMRLLENLSQIKTTYLSFIVVMICFNYYLFKLSINFGISRQSLYKVKLSLLCSIAFIVNIITFSTNLLVYFFDKKDLNSFYIGLYYGFFQNNIFDFTFMFVFGIIFTFFIFIIFNTLGTLLSLLGVVGKIICLVSIYAMFTLPLMLIGIYHDFISTDFSVINTIFSIVTGIHTSNNKCGNPINMLVTLIIIIIIMLFINYKLTKRYQIRR